MGLSRDKAEIAVALEDNDIQRYFGLDSMIL
jgi:hypothetical protein